ncbi:MAG: caspase family protein [Bacteroidota bacterium]
MAFTNDNSYGLVIGVGQRCEDDPLMKISLTDAENVGTALTSFCRIPNLRKLIGEEATCEHIKTELETLANQTRQKKANLVVIYFSGHGCKFGGQYYLIGRDTKNDRIPDTGFNGNEFVAMLQAIHTDKMLVLLDCCHAGGVVAPEEIPFESLQVLGSSNRVIITAGHKSQVSYLSKPVSIFTYALIEGLGGIHFLEGDKTVTVFDLAMYIRERVVTLSQQVLQLEDPQKPQLHALENQQTSNFIVARYANGHARKMFFEEDFSACKGNGKEINPHVANTEDNNYRNNFNWLNVTVVGDGNYIITNPQNSPITINNGLGFEQLKEILKDYLPAAEKLKTILEGKPDQASKNLHEKLEVADIELLIDEPTDENIAIGIKKFMDMLKQKNRMADDSYTYILTLKRGFTTYKNRKLSRFKTDGEFEEIIVDFRRIINDYKAKFL